MTIKDDVTEIRDDAFDDGTRLNVLADEFRRGRDVNDLVELLEADDPENASIGAWIVGELPLGRYHRNPRVLAALRRLVDHSEPSVRWTALGALSPTLDPGTSETRSLIENLLLDPNEGVRALARVAGQRLNVLRE